MIKRVKQINQINVNHQKKEVSIILGTTFYPYESLLEAAQAFTESCWVFFDGNPEESVLINLKPKADDISLDTLPYEFCNYALGLTQNAKMSFEAESDQQEPPE